MKSKSIFPLGIFFLLSVSLVWSDTLVAHWKLDEGSGALAYDSSVNSNTAMLQDMDPNTCWVSGFDGLALSLDGVDDFLFIPYDSDLDPGTGSFTVLFWFYTATGSGGEIIHNGTSGGSYSGKRYAIALSGGQIYWTIDDNGEGDDPVGKQWTASWPTGVQLEGAWHLVVARRIANVGMDLWIDGEQVGANQFSGGGDIVEEGEDFFIGRRGPDETANSFPGILDDIRIYDYVLSESEITALAAKSTPYDPSPEDGLQDVSITTHLTWQAGKDAVSHDVYFGRNRTAVSNALRLTGDINGDGIVSLNDILIVAEQWLGSSWEPSSDVSGDGSVNLLDLSVVSAGWGDTSVPEFKGNQAETTFDPGTLEENTTYFWRIDEVNGANSESPWTGNVWSFTTETLGPDQASDPSPNTGAHGVSLDTFLSWTAGSGAISHDVYFGTSESAVANAPQLAGDINDDGSVNTLDLEVYTSQWLTDPGSVSQSADIEMDGNVDLADFSVLAGNWSTSVDLIYQGNQTGTTFDPGIMQEGQSYYWRIDEVNSYGTTVGDVWSFTTRGPIVNIMLLGDSITQGGVGYENFRYRLWDKLDSYGYNNINFVGSHDVLSNDTFDSRVFDKDHEGHDGWTADEILYGGRDPAGGSGTLNTWLTALQTASEVPDIVLMHLGTNDVNAGQDNSETIGELKDIIDILRSYNPNVTIMVAKVIPCTLAGSAGVDGLNALIPGLDSYDTATSDVIIVDHNTGFSTSWLADGMNPNAAGAIEISNRWCEALVSTLGYEPIDRQSLVNRHNPVNHSPDALSPLSVGNGGFTFTADFTGLQTFPDFYSGGIPLCIQSDWGWHTFDNTNNYNLSDILVDIDTYGRPVKYPIVTSQYADACEWLRSNPHRLGLARVGLKLKRSDGAAVSLEDCTNIDQQLDLWQGVLTSRFKVEGQDVEVQTCCHPVKDMIAVRIVSDLIAADCLSVTIEFPYGSSSWGPEPGDWNSPQLHQTAIIDETATQVDLHRTLDNDEYYVTLEYGSPANFNQLSTHHYELNPVAGNSFEFVVEFSADPIVSDTPDFSQSLSASETHWQDFWNSGGAIDLSGSTNPLADELERRIVLSQYLTAIQCAGYMPPAETGLTFNSWYGTPHMEMHWWHGVHFSLWGRSSLFERSLDWYETILPKAQQTAAMQGYEGARWPKMVGPDGEENPSSIAAFVLWQEPHPIYYAELGYREHPTQTWLEQYDTIVFETADFIASFMHWDELEQRYVLGAPIMPAQEDYSATSTFNPTYELEYWYWALQTAQLWKERLGLPRDSQWDHVIDYCSPLPVSDNLYLSTESTLDMWTTSNHWQDHPSMLMAYGFLNGPRVDVQTMSNTLDAVLANWEWGTTWGWDFPMVAMTAARVGRPQTAIDVLMMSTFKNTYLANGHNYQGGSLPIYLPGNGGILSATAMMAAGWDGAPCEHAPGFPHDGTWKVRWEALRQMP